MINLIEYCLFSTGFIKSRTSDYGYLNNNEEITVFLNIERNIAHITSEKISINIDCDFDDIPDVIDKILKDPWKYQKHLVRNFMDCLDYFDDHYDKELKDFGLIRNPCFQNIRFNSYGTERPRVDGLEIQYNYGYNEYIWFPYHPGKETIITYLDYDSNEYIDMIKTKEKDIIKKIIKYYPKITHLVEGTKERYLEYKKYRDKLSNGYDEKVVVLNDFFKKYPIEWLKDIKLIGKEIKIV